MALLRSEPQCALMIDLLDDEVPNCRAIKLAAIKGDPYYAQQYFTMFTHIWVGEGPQPSAMQYLRRGIELSPGHGKAHMCAPHAAPENVNMLRHSELGYRLLPGNSFAITNYINNLYFAGYGVDRLLPLARESIDLAPKDPNTLQSMVSIFLQLGEERAALKLANELLVLYEEMHPRTMECLRQNPKQIERLEQGYDPAAEIRQLIAELKAELP